MLLDSHGVGKLCDFGETIAASSAPGAVDGAFVGTACWAAPEILNFPRRYSYASECVAVHSSGDWC